MLSDKAVKKAAAALARFLIRIGANKYVASDITLWWNSEKEKERLFIRPVTLKAEKGGLPSKRTHGGTTLVFPRVWLTENWELEVEVIRHVNSEDNGVHRRFPMAQLLYPFGKPTWMAAIKNAIRHSNNKKAGT